MLPEYDFHTLSPMDFEILACDLIRAEFSIELKAFAHGPDGGIDLRNTDNDTTTVVQCKHYHGSSFSDLKRTARSEKVKMDVVKPDNYYFVTSQDLSLTQQDTLLKELHPHLSSTHNILALRDLNRILGEHPNIEQNHFKLWMASAGIISRIVQSGLWERSEALMEEIQDRVKMYVTTPSFGHARDMLEAKKVCVITGAPGVGKSMLADMLALTYWESGWQIIALASHEIDRCWDAWQSNALQLFHFDDVFGQTDIQERLSRDSGALLSRLIRRVGSDPRKRLVITTRTHILREAELRDEPVQRAGLRARECVIAVTEYGELQRARVLYNHLYFSDLARDIIRTFVAGDNYFQVINHRNFTPRLIEQAILQAPTDETAESLRARMLNVLERPVLLWGCSFRESLSEAARMILMHLASFPTHGGSLEDLRFASKRGETPIEHRKALTQLEGSWIKIVHTADGDYVGTRVWFHDPSCRDFVLAFLDSEPEYFTAVLTHSTTVPQIVQLVRYADARLEGDVKYPNIKAAVSQEIAPLSEQITAIWDDDQDFKTGHPVETLASILSINDTVGLNLELWVAEQTLRLSSRLSLKLRIDDRSARKLANSLHYLCRTPQTQVEFNSCEYLFRAWCDGIYDDIEWDEAVGFMNWAKQAFPSGIFMPEKDEAFSASFERWIASELDNIPSNCDDKETASTWGDAVRERANQYFDDEAFSGLFNRFEERLAEKWDDTEMLDAEHHEAIDHAAAIIEHAQPANSSIAEGASSSSTSLLWGLLSPKPAMAQEIRELFRPLS